MTAVPGRHLVLDRLGRLLLPTYGARANAADSLIELQRTRPIRRAEAADALTRPSPSCPGGTSRVSLLTPRHQLQRTLPHQCAACRRHRALRLVEHPAGNVVVCRYCAAVRRVDTGPAAWGGGAPDRPGAAVTGQRSRGASPTEASDSLELPGTPQAVGAARRHVRGLLEDPADLASGLVGLVVLLTSGLISNAVVHGRAPIVLLLRRQATGARVEVRDGGDMFPAPRLEPSRSQEGGRGLLLGHALARTRGSTTCDVPLGKTVWCEVSADAPRSAASE